MCLNSYLVGIGTEASGNNLVFQSICILGGADKGGEGKSKRTEKYIWNEEKLRTARRALLAVFYFSSCHIFPAV